MKKAILTFSFALLSLVMFAQVSASEKQALLDFYEATNGSNWNNTWDLNQPVTKWQGIGVENNTVVSISLLFNNIEGTLPSSLGNLENLKILELSFNKLQGNIPAELGNLSKLEVLAFNGNNLSGNIPAEIGKLKNLKQLHLSSNTLSGTIPNSFNTLTKLEVLNVFDNNLNGELPTELASSRNLREFIVAENDFNTSDRYSMVLLSNSGSALDLDRPVFTPAANSVIALETSDDE